MKLIIEDDEGRKTVIPLVREEISIGRLEGNTIRLTERNVSRRHARLFKHSGAIVIEDLGSSNGVRVNGERILEQTAVHDGDLIEIGDYDLAIEGLPRTAGITSPSFRVQPTDEGVVELNGSFEDVSEHGRELAADGMPHLVGLNGSLFGEEIPLTRSSVTFGRAADINDIAIDDSSVSRSHGQFKLEADGWHIIDSKSSHGIKVNGQSVTSGSVTPGDVIEIGSTRFRFCAPGEDFTPQRESYEATQVARISPPPATKSPVTTIVIGGVAVAALVVIGWVMTHPSGGTRPATPEAENQHCQAAKAALDEKNWAEAIQNISVAKQLGAQCPFDLDGALKSAQTNKEIKSALDGADDLIKKGKFRQVIDSLDRVSPTSPYGDAARAKVMESKVEGVKQLSLEAQGAVDKGHLDEATGIIAELQGIDSSAASLPFLQKQLTERKESAARERESRSNKSESTPPPSAPASPVPTPAVVPAAAVPADRNVAAKQDIADGIMLMKNGNFDAGAEKIKAAIALKPDPEWMALAHKNLGVGYAKNGKTDEAITHLKIYLKLKPDAPDKAKFEQIIQQIEQR